MGPIPQGRQFGTFQKGSFQGYPGLCEFPLPKRCRNSKTQPKSIPQEGKDSKYGVDGEFDRKVVLVGCGCGAVIGLIAGHIMLTPNRIEQCLNTFGRLKRR